MSDGVAVRRARTVAVIEDDPDIRWLLEELAQDAGFEVQMYATYDEALMRLAAQPVDAIIADCIDCGYITPTESDRARLAELSDDLEPTAPTILHSRARAPGRTTTTWFDLAATLDVDSVVHKRLDRLLSVLLARGPHSDLAGR